jgi:predicted ester cyclase
MKPEEIVKSMMDAVQNGDFKKARTYLTEDFQFSGPVPKPLNPDEWIGISTVLRTAFPDLQYQFKLEGMSGNVVQGSAELSGTHKGELDLSMMGLGVIPATGKSFHAAREHVEITLRGDKISEFRSESRKDAGVPFILESLGVKLPVM